MPTHRASRRLAAALSLVLLPVTACAPQGDPGDEAWNGLQAITRESGTSQVARVTVLLSRPSITKSAIAPQATLDVSTVKGSEIRAWRFDGDRAESSDGYREEQDGVAREQTFALSEARVRELVRWGVEKRDAADCEAASVTIVVPAAGHEIVTARCVDGDVLAAMVDGGPITLPAKDADAGAYLQTAVDVLARATGDKGVSYVKIGASIGTKVAYATAEKSMQRLDGRPCRPTIGVLPDQPTISATCAGFDEHDNPAGVTSQRPTATAVNKILGTIANVPVTGAGAPAVELHGFQTRDGWEWRAQGADQQQTDLGRYDVNGDPKR